MNKIKYLVLAFVAVCLTAAISSCEKDKEVETVDEKTVERVDLDSKAAAKGAPIWLRVDGDFQSHRDIATFYYSLDGNTWTQLGGEYRMRFNWQQFFMGSKYAIFNYATKRAGGWVDVDDFTAN